MTVTPQLLAALLAVAVAAPSAAQHDPAAHHGRAADGPRGLSADEAAGLAEGRGLGMARPAELHGYPGPLHVLELAEPLGLTDDQRAEAERLRAAMLDEAVALGERILLAERHLDALFVHEEASADAVGRMTGHIAEMHGQLRAVHLRAHLAMRDALGPDQLAAYAQLRGYAE